MGALGFEPRPEAPKASILTKLDYAPLSMKSSYKNLSLVNEKIYLLFHYFF